MKVVGNALIGGMVDAVKTAITQVISSQGQIHPLGYYIFDTTECLGRKSVGNQSYYSLAPNRREVRSCNGVATVARASSGYAGMSSCSVS